MKVVEVPKLLRKDGEQQVRQTGSHRQFHHPTKPGTVTVAGKRSENLDHKTLASILRQAGLRPSEG